MEDLKTKVGAYRNMDAKSKSTFNIITLPRLPEGSETDTHSIALAEKFRSLRLHALKTAPEAFASSYDVESQRGLEQTFQRLNNPKAVNLLAVKDNRDILSTTGIEENIDALLATDWVGTIVLIGPDESGSTPTVSARADPFERITASAPQRSLSQKADMSAAPNPTCLHYHLNGVFVCDSARNGGLGKALIEAALQKAEAQARRLQCAFRCTILVDSRNEAALRLYEKAGFGVVGEETYVQQPRKMLGEQQVAQRVALQLVLHYGQIPSPPFVYSN